MKLTIKQERFVMEYVATGNATAAYRAVYNCQRMKPETVNRAAKELLDHPNISPRIKAVQSEVAEKLLVSDDSVLKEHARIAFSDIRRLFDESGRLQKVHELDADTAAAISSFKISVKKGKDTGTIVEVKLWPKTNALQALSKSLGLFEQDNRQRKIDLNVSTDELVKRLEDLQARLR